MIGDERKCQIEGCRKPTKDRHSHCPMHEARIKRHGDPHHVTARSEFKPRKDAAPPVCQVAGCDRPVHAKSRCSTHYHVWRREQGLTSGPVNGTTEALPIQPLLDYIEERGGFAACMEEAGVMNLPGNRRREAMRKNLDRAIKRDAIPVVTADAMIIRLFGVHPFEVYGDAWWSQDTDDLLEAA